MQADQINENEMKLEFDARSVNEGFARMAVAAFVAELNPTLDEISDIKTAVSEAVTNAIIHGYDSPEEKVEVSCKLCGNHAEITVKDHGHGIADVQKPWNLFLRRDRNWSVPAWDLLLWKHLWMKSRYIQHPEKEQLLR